MDNYNNHQSKCDTLNQLSIFVIIIFTNIQCWESYCTSVACKTTCSSASADRKHTETPERDWELISVRQRGAIRTELWCLSVTTADVRKVLLRVNLKELLVQIINLDLISNSSVWQQTVPSCFNTGSYRSAVCRASVTSVRWDAAQSLKILKDFTTLMLWNDK